MKMFHRTARSEGQESAPASNFDTVIGAGSKVDGGLTVQGDLKVLGEIDGPVMATGLVEMELGASIEGDVRAERASVAGRIKGDMYIQDSLELRAGAHLRGDVFAKSFRIQDGAIFQGQCHMGKDVPPIHSQRAQTGNR